MQVHRRKRRLTAAVCTALGLTALLATAVAWAVKVDANNVTIYGAQSTAWDTDNEETACQASTGGFSPANDGSWGIGDDQASDAFDGGLLFVVDTTDFADANGIINLRRVDRYGVAGNAGGLHVSERARALQTSPTLRLLLQLRNSGGTAKTRDLFLTSNLGSDGATAIRDTSSGDTTLTTGDRWVVTSDSATTPSDPPVTHVLFGKGAKAKVLEVVDAPGSPPNVDCLTVRYHVKVPAHGSRFLLFFAEMHNPASNGPAINAAEKFNKRHLNNKLLDGISEKLRNKIRNWDL